MGINTVWNLNGISEPGQMKCEAATDLLNEHTDSTYLSFWNGKAKEMWRILHRSTAWSDAFFLVWFNIKSHNTGGYCRQ